MGFDRCGLKSRASFCLLADALEFLQPAKLSTFHVCFLLFFGGGLTRVSTGTPHMLSLLRIRDDADWIRFLTFACVQMHPGYVRNVGVEQNLSGCWRIIRDQQLPSHPSHEPLILLLMHPGHVTGVLSGLICPYLICTSQTSEAEGSACLFHAAPLF